MIKKICSLFAISWLCLSTNAQINSIVLGRPTDTSITVSVLFNSSMQFFIEYGTATGNYSFSTTSINHSLNVPDEVDLRNLLPNTKYYYRLKYKISSASTFSYSSEYTFYTQRAKGSTFTFTIETDEHLYDKKGVGNMYKVTLQNQAADKPDFMITLGDIFGDDHTPNTSTSYQMDTLHKYYRPFLGQITHSIPFYVCLGNHEGEKKYYLVNNAPNNIAVWGTLWRKYYYPNPYPNGFYTGDTVAESYGMGLPENYYAWNWGDALFIVMDVYRYDCDTTAKPHNWDWTIGDKQYAWLKSTLENSTAKYKFAFAHHVRGEDRGGILNAKLYEWGGYDGANGNTYSFPTRRPGWAKPIHKLFVDNGLNIFFQGHDHVFAHEVMDNVTYQSCPMAADSTYEIGMLANASAYVSDTVDGTGHIRVVVSPSCLKVDYVKAYLPADTLSGAHKNREIGFSYTIGTCNSTSVLPLVNEKEITIVPNPANQQLDIQVAYGLAFKEANLFDALGRTVFSTKQKQINTSELPDGLYYLQAIVNETRIVKKVIIQH
jgi:hypothetical protein